MRRPLKCYHNIYLLSQDVFSFDEGLDDRPETSYSLQHINRYVGVFPATDMAGQGNRFARPVSCGSPNRQASSVAGQWCNARAATNPPMRVRHLPLTCRESAGRSGPVDRGRRGLARAAVRSCSDRGVRVIEYTVIEEHPHLW